MSDNKEATGTADRTRINVNEDYEVQYWTGKFGVSAKDLKRAVEEVGDNALEVEVFFNKEARARAAAKSE